MGRPVPDAEALELTKDLVRVESHSAPGFEARVAETIASYLRAHDVPTEVWEAGPGRPNVVSVLEGTGKGRTLMLTGHMDTVPAPQWDAPGGPFEPTLVGDRLYGRGAADMKGALAAMMVALCAAAKGPRLNGNVVFAAVAGEEGGGSVGTVELARIGPTAGYAVVGEPTGLDVCVTHKGSHNMVVALTGKAAHSATPEQGLNAVAAVARAITLIGQEVTPWVNSFGNSLLGSSTLTVTIVEGGGRTDTVPPSAMATYNMRYVPGVMPAEVEERIMRALRPLTNDGFGVSVGRRRVPRVSVGGTYELETVPLVTDVSHALVTAAREAVFRVTGREAGIMGVPFWTDAAVLSSKARSTTIILGPGDISCAHGPREWIDINQVLQSAGIYREMIARLCQGA